MTTILTIVHIVVCLFLIVIVLLQHGKGADMGAAFGGSSQTVFGTEGPLPLLNKITTGAAILFMITSITLAYLSSNHGGGSVMRGVKAPVATEQKTEQAPVTVPLPSAAPAGQTEKAPQSLPAQEEKPQATP